MTTFPDPKTVDPATTDRPTTPGVSLMGMLAAEEAIRDHQATEALFLTYNVDLGFLEARLLGLCQATGARVSVLADARVWAPDSRAVRHIGRGYHVGLAATSGAFHPKMLVLAGPKRALVAVGSGNLTMGGWQYNAELLTVFTGDRNGVPEPIAQVPDMLRSLANESLRLDPLTRAAIDRTVQQLEALLNGATRLDTGHTLAASWDGPLIDRLPTEPVAELCLYAPFYDPQAAAVEALLNRLRPQRIRVALQPDWTKVDPHALHRVLDRYTRTHHADAQVVADAEPSHAGKARYRHGKLIEWLTPEGKRFALTGSPNLSKAALLGVPRAGTDGCNHEIAVLGPVGASLFPPGESVDLLTLPVPDNRDDQDDDKHKPSLMILAAARVPAHAADADDAAAIDVYLSAQAPTGTTIQISPRTTSPDIWYDAGPIPKGAQHVRVDVDLDGGSRVRLHQADHASGEIWHSATAFVTDPERTRRRHTDTTSTSKTHRTTPLDLFGEDTKFMSAVLDDLKRFASEVQVARGPGPSRPAGVGEDQSDDGRTSASDHRIEPWLWLEDDAVQRLGPSLAGFALGLPPLIAGDDPTLGWADRLTDETDLGLEDDSAEETATTEEDEENEESQDGTPQPGHSDGPLGTPEDEQPLDQRHDKESQRTARRRWCARATALAPHLTLGSQLFVCRTLLRVWSAGNWDPDDSEPLDLLNELLTSLDRIGLPSEAEKRVGSITAVALTLARAAVDHRSHNAATLKYHRLAQDYSHLLLAADSDLIDQYVIGLATLDGVTLRAESVADTCDDLTTEDPLADVEDRLSQDGHDICRPAPHLLHVTGKFTNPEPIALDAVGQSEHQSGIGVWATSHTGDWTLVVWQKPELVTVTDRNGRQRWRHQTLADTIGPGAIAYQQRTGTVTSQYDHVTRPKHLPTERARAVLALVGITEVQPPR